MKTEKEIIDRMKQVEEACIMAVKFDVPTTSFELMLKVLDWVLQDSDVKQ